jgi:hypothetical protein
MPVLSRATPRLCRVRNQAVVYLGGEAHYLGRYGSPEAKKRFRRVLNAPAQFPRATIGRQQGVWPVAEAARLWGVSDQAVYDAIGDGRLCKAIAPSPRRTGRKTVIGVANPPSTFPLKPHRGRFVARRNGQPDAITLQPIAGSPIKRRKGGPKPRYSAEADRRLLADYRTAGGGEKEFARCKAMSVKDLRNAFSRIRARELRTNSAKQSPVNSQ